MRVEMKKKALWKDFYMEVRTTWNRFLSILLIVALGVAFFAGIRATNPDMRITADSYFDNSRLMDIRVMGTWGLTEQDITAIAELDSVETIEPIYTTHVVCDVEGNELVVEVMSATKELNLITVSEGRMPEHEQEVLVDSFFLTSTGYQLGDTITLKSGSKEELSYTLKEDTFTIVGVGSTPYYLSFQRGSTNIGSGNVDSFIVVQPSVFALEVYTSAYVAVSGAKDLTSFSEEYTNHIDQTVSVIETLANEQNNDRYEEKYKEAADLIEASKKEFTQSKDEVEIEFGNQLAALQSMPMTEEQRDLALFEIEKAKQAAEEEFIKVENQIISAETDLSALIPPEWYVLDRNTIEAYVEYEQNANQIGALGQVFPAIFFLVAALISLTTMTRMVEEERTQIGVLKALGYTKKAIAMKYILYALLATLGGSVIGALIGLKLLPMIIITAYKMMYRNIPEVLTPFNTYYAVLATVLSMLSVGLATFFAVAKELKAKPAHLMRPSAPKTGKRVILERLPILWKHLSFTWKATLRNLFRYKKRFFMTIFGIGGCMALLLVGFGLQDSIFVIYNKQFDEILLYEATINLDEDTAIEEKDNLEAAFENEALIKGYMRAKESNITISNGKKEEKVLLSVFEEPMRIKQFVTLKSRKGRDAFELSADKVIITEQMADMLRLSAGDTIRIELDGTEVEAVIDGIAENYMSHYVYMSPELYTQLFDREVQYNRYYLLTPEANVKTEQELGNRLLGIAGITGISYVSHFRNLMDNVIVSLDIVIWVLIIAAGVLAYIVLYNLNNININERRRELATIRVLGFYDKELAAYVYRENILLTVIGMIFGVVFGALLHRYVIETVEIELFMFGRNIELASYIYSILLTALFSAIVNFVMFFKLRKINMVESLKSVE